MAKHFIFPVVETNFKTTQLVKTFFLKGNFWIHSEAIAINFVVKRHFKWKWLV